MIKIFKPKINDILDFEDEHYIELLKYGKPKVDQWSPWRNTVDTLILHHVGATVDGPVFENRSSA